MNLSPPGLYLPGYAQTMNPKTNRRKYRDMLSSWMGGSLVFCSFEVLGIDAGTFRMCRRKASNSVGEGGSGAAKRRDDHVE